MKLPGRKTGRDRPGPGRMRNSTDASQVLYVARAGNFRAHGFDYHGALRILKVIMEYDYLWINIRVRRSILGRTAAQMKNGDTYFVSYRDPNLEKTNEIYDGNPLHILSSLLRMNVT